MAKHSIYLTMPEVQAINYSPYRAGPKARKFKKPKIDKTSA